MSELRLNVVTKEWVIIAPERASRPYDHIQGAKPAPPPFVPNCPFCPGNEALTTTEVFRIPADDGSWSTRAVPNKYPVLTSSTANPEHRHAGLMHTVEGFGIHEVIVETPRHDLGIAQLPLPQVQAIVHTYRERYNACRYDPRIAHVILFKNHGAGAGTSLVHPHSQIIGTPVISYQVRDRIRTLEEHLALYGECVLCRMIREEIEQGTRILHINESFVALIPYAALSRFHIWIFPRRHMGRFGDVTDAELGHMAQTLRAVLQQLHYGLGDPDFNYLIRSAPRTCTNEEFHWYLSIVPRIGQAAGFELGSGIYVNTSLPEESAAFLRSVRIPEDVRD
jgi:UDPglucose--hexose-1-phosphate uridylyltransferase